MIIAVLPDCKETKKLRTFGNLKESHDIYTTIYDSNRKLAKNFYRPVEETDVKVLDKCPVEELHAMMGFVNHTFRDGYDKVVGGREQAVKFQKMFVVRLEKKNLTCQIKNFFFLSGGHMPLKMWVNLPNNKYKYKYTPTTLKISVK